jgi:WD40 repeat protein
LLDVKGFSNRACDTASDGRIFFLGEADNHVSLTELAPGASRSLAQALHAPLGFWHKLAVSPEGRILAACSERGLELWDLRTTQRLAAWPIGACTADFDNAGRLIVGCASGVYRWLRRVETIAAPTREVAPSSADRIVVRFGPSEQLVGPIVPHSLSINPSDETMVFEDAIGWRVTHPDNAAAMVRLETKYDPRKSAISRDNRYAAIANWDYGGVGVWDAGSGAHLADLAVGRCGVVQFSPDGCLLAATPDGVTLWRCGDWRRVRQLHAHGTTPTGLGIAFSPDSRVLAVGQPNGILRLVDPRTGNDWARLTHLNMSVAAVMAFSPDQRYLVTSTTDERSTTQVWDVRAMRGELEHRGLDWPAEVLTVSASPPPVEGSFEVVLDDDGLMHQLDAATRSKAAGHLLQSAVNLLKRAMHAATGRKATE